MPITLPPISRRRFLGTSLATGAALALRPRFNFADDAIARDPDRVILFSDIHIAADPTHIARDINMTDHLKQAVAEALALDQSSHHPSMAIVNGDCAFNNGETADYGQVVNLLKPLRDAGLPVHLALGNHDNRERFWAAIPPEEGGGTEPDRPVENRQILVLETPKTDWIILDSLIKTKTTPGSLGDAQLKWLADQLDLPKRQAKPVLVMVHHQPQLPNTDQIFIPEPPKTATEPASTKPTHIGGLLDTEALLEVLVPRKNVKALIFGHTHAWSHSEYKGFHLINLPTVAYPFNPVQPSAWTDCLLTDTTGTFSLHTLDPKHPKHGDQLNLTWRA
ncbi:MAG TPA: metallophosphoesterase [Tepidisphaeraceae bacterium]|jgi:hypothetical protein|nr:metallophosphoesterase [Tepidisphaeraceae bacterium]